MKRYNTIEEKIAGRKAALARYYQKNKESILIKTKDWSRENRAKRNDNLRTWRKNNSDRYKATTVAWAERNPDKLRKTYQRYRLKNLEKNKASHRAWLKANPHLTNASNGRRRLNTRFHPDANHALISCVYKETHWLSKTTGIKHATDHIIPVSAGGFNHEENLQPLPKHINESKHCNPFWLSSSSAYRDWRDVPRNLWPHELVPKYIALIAQNKGVSIRWDTAA